MKPKVLFTASRASHLIRFHRPYLRYFHQHGYEVHTLSQGAAFLPEIDHSFDLPFVKKPWSPTNLQTLKRLISTIRAERYHTIICNATLAGLLTRIAVKYSGIPVARVIYISHGYLFSDNHSISSWCKRQFEKVASDAVDKLLVMNGEDFQIAQKYRLAKSIDQIPGMGLCTELFPQLSPVALLEERKKYGYSITDFILLSVGEFSRRKNQLQLLKAMTLLSDLPQLKVLLVGDGALLEDCRRFVDNANLSETVLFAKEQDNLNRIYRFSDALISTSRSEGLPFNIMEALYCGLPILATRVKGHCDLLQDRINALLFEPDSPEELAQTIRRLYLDRTFYQRLQEHTSLPQKYQIDQVLPIVVEQYGIPVSSVTKIPSMEVSI